MMKKNGNEMRQTSGFSSSALLIKKSHLLVRKSDTKTTKIIKFMDPDFFLLFNLFIV